MDASVLYVPIGIEHGRVTCMVPASMCTSDDEQPLTIDLLRELDRAIHMPWIGDRFNRAPFPRHERYACFAVWMAIRGNVFDARTHDLLAALATNKSVGVDACAAVSARTLPCGLYILTRFISGRPLAACHADDTNSLPRVLGAFCNAADTESTWRATQYFGAAIHLALTRARAPWEEVIKHIGWAPACPFADDAKRTQSVLVYMWNWMWQLMVVDDSTTEQLGSTDDDRASMLRRASTKRCQLPADAFMHLYALFQRLFETNQQPLLLRAQTLVWFGLLAAWLGPATVYNDDVDAAVACALDDGVDVSAHRLSSLPAMLPAPALCGWLPTPARAIREYIAATYSMWEVIGTNTALSSAARHMIETQMQLAHFVQARCAVVLSAATRAIIDVPHFTSSAMATSHF